MSFADEAEKQDQGGYRARGCGVGAMLARLDPDLSAEVNHVIVDRPDITTAGIHRALRDRGITGIPSVYTLGRHRKGACGCE